MCFFRKKKMEETKLKGRKETPEVINARKLLEAAHPTLLPRGSSSIVCRPPFNYLGLSQHGEYIRYHFCEGVNKRIYCITIALISLK